MSAIMALVVITLALTPTSHGQSMNRDNAGSIVGAVAGGIVLVIGIIGCCVICLHYKHQDPTRPRPECGIPRHIQSTNPKTSTPRAIYQNFVLAQDVINGDTLPPGFSTQLRDSHLQEVPPPSYHIAINYPPPPYRTTTLYPTSNKHCSPFSNHQ